MENAIVPLRPVLTVIIAIATCGCSDTRETPTNDLAKATPEAGASSDASRSRVPGAEHRFPGPRGVIAEGRLTVDVMELVAPRRAMELAQRLKRAAQKDPDWWMARVKKAKPGDPLPYDPRLGLSESEYREFLAMRATMRKKTQATLAVSAKGDQVYALDGGESLPDFTGIEIDLKNDLVRTPFGVLTHRAEISTPEDSALGACDGVEWRLEKLDPDAMSRTAAKLLLGTLKRSGRCVINYEVKKLGAEGMTRIAHTLEFDPPARQ